MTSYAILGTGAIGSTIGGYMSRAGHDITLIDTWADHVDAMSSSGLTVSADKEEFTTQVRAVHLGDVNALNQQFDVIILAVKSYDTIWATHFALNYLAPNGFIVSAQNGVNDDIIGAIAGFGRIVGCIVTIGAGIYEPAKVQHTSASDRLAFTIGEPHGIVTNRAKQIAEALTTVGPTKTTTNLWGQRWAKLATNCMANPLCALTGLGSAAQRTTSGVVDAGILIAREVVTTAKHIGIQVENINNIPADSYEQSTNPEIFEEVKSELAVAAVQLGEGRPSMLQDVMKGRRTEISFLNGYVDSKAAAMGVETPMCSAITKLVKRVENGELKSDLQNIKLLKP